MNYPISILLVGLYCSISCDPQKSSPDTIESTQQLDTVVLKTAIRKAEFITESPNSKEVNSKLMELFRLPLDVRAYKKKKGGSNSGLATRHPYLYKPDTTGTYYQYMLFQRVNENKYSERERFTGLVLKTYIYGTEIGRYENVEEEFIGIKSRLIDPDLGPLNMVGQSTDELHAIYEIGFPQHDSLVVVANKGDLLILHYQPDSYGTNRIDWFNFLRTNLSVQSTHDLPETLKCYEERMK